MKQVSSVLHPATKLLKEKVLNGEFFYLENNLLEINFQNAKVVLNNNNDTYINKKKSTGKIDMVASLIDAVFLLQQDVIFNSDSNWAIQVFSKFSH